MPDDLPLEGAARRLSGPADGPHRRARPIRLFTRKSRDPAGPHVWQRRLGWELLLAASTLLPAVFIAVEDLPPWQRILAAGSLAAIPLLYVLFGRPSIRNGDRRRGVVYIVLLVALFTPAVLIEPSASIALFGLCSQCFMVLRARWAIVGLIALNLPLAVRYVVQEDQRSSFNFLTIIITVIFFSSLFGIWMERIMEQSEERAALIQELEAQRAEVARLSAEHGAMAERERLAGEIHDTLAQGFTSIIMLLQAAEAQPDPSRHLALAVRTARENLAEARALISALSPAPLDGPSLDEALLRLTDRLGEETGIVTGFSVTGEPRPLPRPAEVVLLRATQEALANVRRHAEAGRAEVTVAYRPESVALGVRDDGRGFDTAATPGYGLRGMRARVEQAGGSVTVTSSPGAGTLLEVVLPSGPARPGATLPGATLPGATLLGATLPGPTATAAAAAAGPASVPPARTPPAAVTADAHPTEPGV
ncbi:sensor histidine kinase [Microbispora rosea]|uniref:sensor histidine kinase n=1 Tax=Microbispora rosea TaxID=58117 RepID=UPI0037AB1167